MNLDNLFSLAGILTEIAVVGLLFYRRVWRTLPVFFVYCIWALCSDAVATATWFYSPKGYSFNFYVATTVIDLAMQLSVIVELAWSVLRPLRAGLSRSAIWFVAALILVVGAAIWPLANTSGIALPSRAWHLMIQMEQTVSILRVLFFLGLVGCSQLLSLGWRNRELQVATGFGFYSLVSLGVAAVNAHLSTAGQFKQLYSVVAISFLGSLLYWIYSFAYQEAERREFTPQAREILLAFAKSAHVTRVQMTEFAATGQESRDAY
jgi:hypothetical protein